VPLFPGVNSVLNLHKVRHSKGKGENSAEVLNSKIGGTNILKKITIEDIELDQVQWGIKGGKFFFTSGGKKKRRGGVIRLMKREELGVIHRKRRKGLFL